MMMDQWMEDDAGEPALNKDFLSGLRDLKVKDGNFSSCCCLPYSLKIGLKRHHKQSPNEESPNEKSPKVGKSKHSSLHLTDPNPT